MYILHLTDWHLRDNNSTVEALREAYFEEYLHSLLEQLPSAPDCIFITGDIVDKAKFENYDWAEKIIDYLKGFFPSKEINVFISNGNHDVCRETGCKNSFNDFQKSYLSCSNLIVESNDDYIIYKLNESDAVLMIDSIGPNYKNGFPRALKELEDNIVVKIRGLKLKDLFVLSHHPAVTQLSEFTSGEEEDWNKEHIWSSGADLSRRLASRPNLSGQLFWFAGDIHIPEHVVHDQSRIMFSTGSLYAVGVDDKTKLRPNARFIDTSNYESSILFQYEFKTHKGKHLDGEWIPSEVKARLSDNASPKSEVSNKPNEIENKLIKDKSDDQCFLLDSEFEKSLFDEVVLNELCQQGLSLQINSKYSQLSWISITSLLSKRETYRNTIKRFRDQVVSIIEKSPSGSVRKEDCLFIGVDNWGAIIGARLGAATNIKSCSIAVKNEVSAYEDAEIINSELKKIITDKKVLFVVSDVIVTGHTIKRVIDELEVKSDIKVYSLTIFFDKAQTRDLDFKYLAGFYYLCGKVKTPFIESRLLVNS